MQIGNYQKAADRQLLKNWVHFPGFRQT